MLHSIAARFVLTISHFIVRGLLRPLHRASLLARGLAMTGLYKRHVPAPAAHEVLFS